ncbi:MAG: hypothetical protein UV36_C0047G0001 [Parcubacteria group bacterium GW2011_GWC2_42_6]|nr:MAG: hypothetical protein UV36_C0047G0001 [Parcubacteria group bacterium GW2011_GWC2_42_6]
MEKYPLIRKIYLYVFSGVGLVMMIVAGVQLVNLGLKAWVFTQIERQESSYDKMPTCGPMGIEKVEVAANSTTAVQLTEAERTSMKSWLVDYQRWQEQQGTYSIVTANRQRTAATAIALIVIGLPIFLFHWGLVRRDSKKGV